MGSVAIVDYGMCNLDSVARAVVECGGKSIITNREEDFQRATHIILPGVGAFPDAMQNLRKLDLHKILFREVIQNRIPFLGICLGMQLLATRSYEGGETEGLGWIPGEVLPLKPPDKKTRIPHIGWNEVIFSRKHPLLESLESGKDFYFVHKYHFQCEKSKNVFGRTPYCGGFCSIISSGNIFGTQFHPEKSQKPGFILLRNFLNYQGE
ncbi:imidazole glycerol phosphate synthase subunit HisH [Candidatus Riflebacteria bacterium]